MGVSESQRELELSFDGEQITLSRPDAVSDAEHDVRTFRFYDGQRLRTTIRARTSTAKPRLQKTAWSTRQKRRPATNPTLPPGPTSKPSWKSVASATPASRLAGVSRGHRRGGLSDPLQIIQKTKGRMAEDQQWLEVLP
ncbi:MAG: hypothetical protein ACLT1A_00840 [Dysosmobacter sp.]